MTTYRAARGREFTSDGRTAVASLDIEEVRSSVALDGWVRLSGFDIELEEFLAFAARFGECTPARKVHYPPSGEGLGYHAEDGYNPFRPDAILFLCIDPGKDGGVPTCVVDGRTVMVGMDPETAAFTRANRVRFDRHWSAELWEKAANGDEAGARAYLRSLPGLKHREGDGRLLTSYEMDMVLRTPQGQECFSNTMLQARTEQPFYGMYLGDGSEVPETLLDSIQEVALEHEQQINWRPGDAAIVNNRIMMHRRPSYTGGDRDLRVLHCDSFFLDREFPVTPPEREGVRALVQSELGYPDSTAAEDL